MRGKKGFTLIEMMIVIAIIAVLVAVMIPILNGSTTKAAAATNAANLRGVEGEVVTMMLLQPELFDKGNAEQVAQVGTMLDYMVANRDDAFAQYDQTEQNVANMAQALKNAEDEFEAAKDLLTDAQTQKATAEALINTTKNTLIPAAESGVAVAKRALQLAQLFGGDTTGAEAILASAEKELADLKADLADSTDELEKLEKKIKELADETVKTAEQTYKDAQDNLKAAQDALAEYEDDFKNNYDNTIKELEDQYYELMYIYTAVDGELDLNGATLAAPGSKAMKHENLTIDEDVQMVVFVDIENKEAYAMYAGYEVKDFAAIADKTE